MIALLLAAALLSPDALYAKAVAAMSGLPQPQYVTYNLQANGDGLLVDLVLQRGQVWLNVHGGSGSTNWALQHRTYDYASRIVNDADNQRYVTQRSFFDPTWYGASRALRECMFDSQDPAPPRPQHTQAPAPDVTLKTIAVSSVIGPSVYAITDVIIDLHSTRFLHDALCRNVGLWLSRLSGTALYGRRRLLDADGRRARWNAANLRHFHTSRHVALPPSRHAVPVIAAAGHVSYAVARRRART